MMPLWGRSSAVLRRGPIPTGPRRLTVGPPQPDEVVLVERDWDDGELPESVLYLVRHDVDRMPGAGTAIVLPASLDHVSAGDIVGCSGDGARVDVLWRHRSRQNSILLTERCDNYCLMCSQPPRDVDDDWLLDRAAAVIELLPPDIGGLAFTGGEPTSYGDRLLHLLQRCGQRFGPTPVHLLSNGRRFADPAFAEAYAAAAADVPGLMVGIPIYGAEPTLHDFVVQADGAFDETVRGILHLAQLQQRVELRVVVHRQTAPVLVEIAEFIARNLPFVEQVALMGLEVIGLARPNIDDVWIDPHDYRSTLTEAALLLRDTGVRTLVYNHQLCLLEPEVWPLAVQSISDWKNEYHDECGRCAVMDRCGGFFASSSFRRSQHIRALAGSAPD